MTYTLGIAIYFVIWWTVLFAVLPWGLKTQAEDGEIVPGTPESAPANPKILRLFLINTLVSALVFAVFLAVVYSGWIDLDALFNAREPQGLPPL